MTDWYYSDDQRQRHGPVTASDLALLHAQGRIAPHTLVWREGLPEWRPWRELVGEVVPETAVPSPGRATFAAPPQDAAPTAAGGNPYEIVQPRSPYAPPQAAVASDAAPVAGGEVVYAGFRKRLAAVTIDGFAVGIATYVVQIVGLGAMGVGLAQANDPGAVMAGAGLVGMLLFMFVVPVAMNAVYYAAMHASGRQATLGKMAVGIKVTDEAGRRISFLRGLGRYFATWISALIMAIGYLMAAFTDRKRALHDMLAGTLVVDQWAFTAHPERQRRELGTVTVVVLILLGLLVAMYVGLIALAIGLGAAGALGGR